MAMVDLFHRFPVSISSRDSLYWRIIPFWSPREGGVHRTEADVGEVLVITMLTGLLTGAIRT